MPVLKKRSTLILLLASAFQCVWTFFKLWKILVFVELFEVAVLKTFISKKVSESFGAFFKKALKPQRTTFLLDRQKAFSNLLGAEILHVAS